MSKIEKQSTNSKPQIDLLNNYYVVKELNFVWCIDFTELDNAKVFSIIDLSTREIKAHCTKPKNFSLPPGDVLKQIITTIELASTKEGYPVIVHHDLEAIFQSPIFSNYFSSLGIKQSFASHKHNKFRNQAIERYHKTFRQKVKDLLITKYGLTGNKAKQALNFIKKLPLLEQHELFGKAIELYNASPHCHLNGESPNEMNLALSLDLEDEEEQKSTILDPEIVPNSELLSNDELVDYMGSIVAKNGTLEAEKIYQYKRELIISKNEFVVEATRSLLRHVSTIQELQTTTLSEVTKSKEQIIQSLEQVINDQNNKLETQSKQLEELSVTTDKHYQTLEKLRALEEGRRSAELVAEEKRQKRRERDRKAARSAATFPELQMALDNITKSTSYRTERSKAMDRICLITLYITGMRVSNLLLLTKSNLDQLKAGKELRLPSIKSKKIGIITWPLVNFTKNLVKTYKADLELLSNGKEDQDLVFPSQKDAKKALDRAWLTKRLNKILAPVGKAFGGKILTTHSFRIGVITALIEVAGVHKAKDLIGHSNIATTYLYNRSTLTPEEERLILRDAESVKQDKQPRYQKPRKRKVKHQTKDLNSSSAEETL